MDNYVELSNLETNHPETYNNSLKIVNMADILMVGIC